MTIEKLLEKCEDAYLEDDYKRLIKLCDEVLEKDSDNQTALGYKSISYCFLNRPERALELLKEAKRLHPKNYYFKNISAMAYYDLGEYEKSLECCDEGLKIKDFDWLVENRIKALLKLDRVDEAIECYENSTLYIEIVDLMIEAGKYREAISYASDAESDDLPSVIDKVKERSHDEMGDYYISWIYRIKSWNSTKICPDCGGELIPIVWGYPNQNLLEKAERGEVFLGGCVPPPNNPNYRCKECDSEFDLGFAGFRIGYKNDPLSDYIEYKIMELTSMLKSSRISFKRSLESLKGDLKGYDDEEFNAFISHLMSLGYLRQPREGYVELTAFDNLVHAKDYLDEGKFAAPLWLAFPSYSAWTIGWRMGMGEDYGMNHPHHSKEYKELFPMPKYWQFRFAESPYKPHPLIGYFWTEDGKPKYPNSSGGIVVNNFINLDDRGEFFADTFRFNSIANAVEISKYLYFEKYGSKRDDLSNFRPTLQQEEIWQTYNYSVLLNAGFLKIMQDEDLKRKLLETGDEPLVYLSDDGENLFGRALMEIRDEIRRVCRNEDKIDWEYTEYLKHKPWG